MPDGSNGLTDDLFADLIESVREGGTILHGERAPARQFEFEGATEMTVLPGVLANNLDIVFCGTAVSNVSAQREAFYAGPDNMFWPTLYAVGLTARRNMP